MFIIFGALTVLGPLAKQLQISQLLLQIIYSLVHLLALTRPIKDFSIACSFLLTSFMNPMKDAYGQIMWAHFNHKESFEIVERDDRYFSVTSGAKLFFSEYKDWPDYERKAIDLAKGRVLEIGCGAGRHSLYLQKKGLDVTGIDASPLAIKVCKLRGLKKAKVMSLTEVSKFKAASFDTIIMMGNNFGLFGSLKRARFLLKRFHTITSPHALVIAHSTDPYKTDNSFHLQYHKFNRKRGRMPGQLRLRIIFLKYVGDWFDYLFVSKDEMLEILKGTGWKVRRFLESRRPSYIAIMEKIQQ